MIRVSNVNGSPESKPTNYYAVHSDNAYFYLFDTKEEQQDYFAAISSVWGKEVYIQQVNDAHNELFRSMYMDRNYLDIGEIPLWLGSEEYGSEAQALINWWTSTCTIVADYLADVTETTIIEDFIGTLPPL